jgi:hypothetical protein
MRYKKFLSAFILIFIIHHGYAQKNLQYSPFHIKDLIIKYDGYSDVVKSDYKTRIWDLFYYKESDIATQRVITNTFNDWFKDDGPEMLTLNEYIGRYKKYFGSKDIKYDTLFNDRVIKKYNFIGYDLYVVRVNWEIKFKEKGKRSWELELQSKSANLYFTIASVKNKNKEPVDKIIRITNYIPDYEPYMPQNAEISITPSITRLKTDQLDAESGIGISWKINPNYLITGKNGFNLFFSPGIGTSYYQFGVKKDSLKYAIDDILDYDGMTYKRLVDGKGIEQDFKLNYFDIPINILLQWYVKSFRFQANAGVNIGILTSASVTRDIGTIKYSGEYDLGTPDDPWIVVLEDLKDKYGFFQYDVKTNDEFSYLNPLNISAIAGIGFGYSPDERIDFNIGLSTCFGLNKIIKKDVPSYLSEKDGEIDPLFYSDNKPKLNSVGLQVGLRYNIQKPNVPYDKKVNRALINQMKSEEMLFAMQGYETQKQFVNFTINGMYLGKMKKVTLNFTGLNDKDDFSRHIKIGPKSNKVKINIPKDESFNNQIDITLKKPFSFNITREGENLRANQISEELIFNGTELKDMPPGGFKLMVSQIPTFDIYYVNLFQVITHTETRTMYDQVFRQIRVDVKNAESKKEECLMYYNSTSAVYYTQYDSLDLFLQTVSQSIHEVSATQFEDFSNALKKNKIDLSRRKVNIYVYTVSLETFRDQVESFLINDLLKMQETINNWENIYITVYTNTDESSKKMKEYVFSTTKLPVLISNWKFVSIL